MKKWWVGYKVRAAERRRIVAANVARLEKDFQQMMLEESERRQVKEKLRLAAKNELKPPVIAIYLASIFLPKCYREIVIGDVTEQYPALRAKLGRFRAYLSVYQQVFFSSWPLVKESLRTENTFDPFIITIGFLFVFIGVLLLIY